MRFAALPSVVRNRGRRFESKDVARHATQSVPGFEDLHFRVRERHLLRRTLKPECGAWDRGHALLRALLRQNADTNQTIVQSATKHWARRYRAGFPSNELRPRT